MVNSYSVPLSNKYSNLSLVCEDCDYFPCECCMDSQCMDCENSVSAITLNGSNNSDQILSTQNNMHSNSDSSSTNFSQNVDNNYSQDLFDVNVSVRPSTGDKDYVAVHVSHSSNDDSNYVPSISTVGVNLYANNESHADNTVISNIEHISSMHLSHMSDNSTTLIHDQSVNINHQLSSSAHLLDLGLKCKGFRIGHINIQGINNKIDQVRLLLESEINQIHIMGISETKLNSVHPETAFTINGFQKPFRRDRVGNSGGGILVYVKDGVWCNRRSDLEH